MEVIVLLMVFASPWAYGGALPEVRLLMEVGVACLMLLWAVRMAIEKRVIWVSSPVIYGLGFLAILACLQMTPLPRNLIALISPTTNLIYNRTLPTHLETVSTPVMEQALLAPSGNTISLDSDDTWLFLLRVLSLLLVFCVTLSNLTAKGTLRRLAIAALITGTLTSLFAIFQFFTSVRGQIYWSSDDGSGGFGTFRNRNHFALYTNLCFGLTFGLLISRLEGRLPQVSTKKRSVRRQDYSSTQRIAAVRRMLVAWMDAENIGLIFALVIMTISVLLSLSRGGLVSLAAGLIVSLLILRTRPGSASAYLGVFFGLLVGALILSWIGYEQVLSRIQSMDPDEVASREGRLPLWARCLRIFADFPVLGTGFGTFEYAETFKRLEDTSYTTIYEHAHNEYLQLLVEAGLPGGIIGLALVFLIFRAGLGTVRSQRLDSDGGIVLGAIVSFLCVAFHSVTDFGMQAPSIAALSAVISAHLCAQGKPQKTTITLKNLHDSQTVRRQNPLALAKAGLIGLTGISTGFLVVYDDWIRMESNRLRATAVLESEAWTEEKARDLTRFGRTAQFLEQATQLTPENASLRQELAYAYFSLAAIGEPEADSTLQENETVEVTDAASASGTGAPKLQVVYRDDPDQVVGVIAPLAPLTIPMSPKQRSQVQKGLEQLLLARNLSPARPNFHLEIADHVKDLSTADPLETYLERATWLSPANSWAWYRRGEIELRFGRTDQALASYHRSLQLSDQFLTQIIQRCVQVFPGREWADTLIPDNPQRLVSAARILDPRGGGEARALLERALQILAERKSATSSVPELQFTANLEDELGLVEEALVTCTQAMQKAGADADTNLRLEYADLLRKSQRYDEARQQILVVLAQYPDHPEARSLLDILEEAVAGGG